MQAPPTTWKRSGSRYFVILVLHKWPSLAWTWEVAAWVRNKHPSTSMPHTQNQSYPSQPGCNCALFDPVSRFPPKNGKPLNSSSSVLIQGNLVGQHTGSTKEGGCTWKIRSGGWVSGLGLSIEEASQSVGMHVSGCPPLHQTTSLWGKGTTDDATARPNTHQPPASTTDDCVTLLPMGRRGTSPQSLSSPEYSWSSSRGWVRLGRRSEVLSATDLTTNLAVIGNGVTATGGVGLGQ